MFLFIPWPKTKLELVNPKHKKKDKQNAVLWNDIFELAILQDY